MKKARKGFTLVELMIVIGIMEILGAMGIIAGQEATSAARAAAIADNLEKLATAGMMFYSDNAAEIDKTGKLTNADTATVVDATALAAGINAYLKEDNEIKAGASNATDNTYFAETAGSNVDTTWWVGYKFGDSDGNDQVRRALANKAHRMKLKTTTNDNGAAYTASIPGQNDAPATQNMTVYMKIR